MTPAFAPASPNALQSPCHTNPVAASPVCTLPRAILSPGTHPLTSPPQQTSDCSFLLPTASPPTTSPPPPVGTRCLFLLPTMTHGKKPARSCLGYRGGQTLFAPGRCSFLSLSVSNVQWGRAVRTQPGCPEGCTRSGCRGFRYGRARLGGAAGATEQSLLLLLSPQ